MADKSIKEELDFLHEGSTSILDKLGMKEQFLRGEINCAMCGTVLTTENLGSLYKEDEQIKMVCDKKNAWRKSYITMTPLESTTTAVASTSSFERCNRTSASGISVWRLGAFSLFLWYVYAHDEQLDRWLARFEKFFLWLGSKKDKRYIRRDIQARINSASKNEQGGRGLVTKRWRFGG